MNNTNDPLRRPMDNNNKGQGSQQDAGKSQSEIKNNQSGFGSGNSGDAR